VTSRESFVVTNVLARLRYPMSDRTCQIPVTVILHFDHCLLCWQVSENWHVYFILIISFGLASAHGPFDHLRQRSRVQFASRVALVLLLILANGLHIKIIINLDSLVPFLWSP
jgi:hypothetical protein